MFSSIDLVISKLNSTIFKIDFHGKIFKIILYNINMVKKYAVVIEKDEDGRYISDVIGLPGCHTQGKTIDQLIERTKEAIKAYLESEEEPEIEQEFIGIQQVEV